MELIKINFYEKYLSKKSLKILPSATLEFNKKVNDFKKKGLNILDLASGEFNFKILSNIKNIVIDFIKNKNFINKYGDVTGILCLKEEIIKYIKNYYNLNYNIKNIIITSGTKMSLFLLFNVLLNKNDEVILPIPFWPTYKEQIIIAGGIVKFVYPEKNFKININILEKVYNKKTKLLILNSPSNPSGVVYTKKELFDISQWIIKKKIFVISDDIYNMFIYNKKKFNSIASFSKEIYNRTIIVNGFSKIFSMAGWRVGYTVCNSYIIEIMKNFASQIVGNTTIISQVAAFAALNNNKINYFNYIKEKMEYYLNEIFPIILEIPGIEIVKPDGSFYLFPNISKTLKICGYNNIDNFVNDLFIKYKVAIVNGKIFGCPENIRINFSVDLKILKKAINYIIKFVKNK